MVMSKNILNLSVDEPQWNDVLPDNRQISENVFAAVTDFVSQNEEIDFLNIDKPLAVNLSLSNDAEVHLLNRQFRKMDKPTNVLSFANIDDEAFEETIAAADEIELGDIIIALETMQREAKEQNISFHDHYCHLLAHGLLHLLGFDHQDDEEAEYMESFEVDILHNLNISNPYKE